MTRTEINAEIAGLQQQEREHRVLAERAAGAIQALQHVLAQMPADPLPWPGKIPVDVDSLGEPAPV